MKPHRLTLVSMSGLRVGQEALLKLGMRMPGLSRRAAALSQLPPLGLLTLAGLVDHRWEQTLVQDDGHRPLDEVVDEIQASRPDVVAFSTLTPAADRAGALSNLLRPSGCVTVVGGLHATAAPGHLRNTFDVIVRGDGETSFPKLLEDWIGDRLQREYHADGTYRFENSPLPRWDLLGAVRPPRYTIQTLRGCPWACSFCAASRLLGPARVKPDTMITRELELISSRQRRPWIELADDNTFASNRDHGPMLEALASHQARWFTESDWRIALNQKLLQQIAGSGCRQILIGMESSVFRYPGMGAKTAELERMTQACQTIQEAGIAVNACFIVGAEGETQASLERLADYLDEAPFAEIQLTLQTPFPGTSLYESLQQQGRLLFRDFSRYTLFDVVYQPDQMTVGDLQDGFMRLVERTFRPPAQSRRDLIRKSIRRTQKKLP